jgi:hypothetical protein
MISNQGTFQYSLSDFHENKIKLVEFDLNLVNMTLPPQLKLLNGIVSGEGQWKGNNGAIEKGSFTFEVLRGQWLGGKSLHQAVLNKIKQQKTEKNIDLRTMATSFDQFQVKGKISPVEYRIEKLNYSLLNNYNFKLAGILNRTADRGKLKGSLVLSKASQNIIDQLGRQDFKFLFTKLIEPELVLQGQN